MCIEKTYILYSLLIKLYIVTYKDYRGNINRRKDAKCLHLIGVRNLGLQ